MNINIVYDADAPIKIVSESMLAGYQLHMQTLNVNDE